MKNKLKAILAEFLGSFTITLASCFTIFFNNSLGNFVLEMATVNALAVVATFYACYSFSGSHLNPGMSLAFIIIGKFPFSIGILYILAQFVGSLLASLVALLCLPSRVSGYGAHPYKAPEDDQFVPVYERYNLSYCYINPLISHSQAFLMEFMLCFTFALVFCAMTIDK